MQKNMNTSTLDVLINTKLLKKGYFSNLINIEVIFIYTKLQNNVTLILFATCPICVSECLVAHNLCKDLSRLRRISSDSEGKN